MPFETCRWGVFSGTETRDFRDVRDEPPLPKLGHPGSGCEFQTFQRKKKMSGTQFFLPRSGPRAEKQNKLGCQTTLQRPYSSVVGKSAILNTFIVLSHVCVFVCESFDRNGFTHSVNWM